MTKEQFDRVLSEKCVVSNGERFAWTIPCPSP
jgi:hypothetical protein